MPRYPASKTNLKSLSEKAAAARLRMSQARNTQERQHLEGMARYWEELIAEQATEADISEE